MKSSVLYRQYFNLAMLRLLTILKPAKHILLILFYLLLPPQLYLAASSLRPSSRLSPCSSSSNTFWLRGLTGKGLLSSRAAWNSFTNLPRKLLASFSIPLTVVAVRPQVNRGRQLKGHKWRLKGR